MALEYVVARNPLGWAILVVGVIVVILTHIVAFFVNGIICGAILWLVPVLCLLFWFFSVMEDPWMVYEATGVVVFGIIWLYGFKLLFLIIGWWLGTFDTDPIFVQESDTLLGLVSSTNNIMETGWEILVFIAILWLAISVIPRLR